MNATTVRVPAHIQFENGTYCYSTHKQVGCYIELKVDSKTVEYTLYGLNGVYTSFRGFRTHNGALRFLVRFAAEIRRCENRHSVPAIQTFEEF